MKLFKKQEMQALEHAAEEKGVPLTEMMEQAGAALAREVMARLGDQPEKKVVLLCGRGNNGGDGFVCARVLAQAGVSCTVLLVQGEPQMELARAAFSRLPQKVLCLCAQNQYAQAQEMLGQATCIVDCIFGFGFRGEVTGLSADFIAKSNELPCLRVAADIPSGVTCDTAQVSAVTFKAHITVAFTGKKPAHCSYPGKEFCGQVVIAQVGVSLGLVKSAKTTVMETDAAFVRAALPTPSVQVNKGSLGRLLLVCGSYGMAGACIMAARGALRCGVGLVHIVVEERLYPILAQAVPEAVFTVLDLQKEGWAEKLGRALETCTACVIGSGLGALADTLCPFVFRYFADSEKPLVIDADGLRYCARTPGALEGLPGPVVITPHPGEMAGLLGCSVGQVQACRLSTAQEFARKTGAVTVLKGAATVTAWEEKAAINSTGNEGMAKGGSGDVLAGVIGALCAQGVAAYQAAVAGAYIHGRAGDICQGRFGGRSMLPTDLEGALPQVFQELAREA